MIYVCDYFFYYLLVIMEAWFQIETALELPHRFDYIRRYHQFVRRQHRLTARPHSQWLRVFHQMYGFKTLEVGAPRSSNVLQCAFCPYTRLCVSAWIEICPN